MADNKVTLEEIKGLLENVGKILTKDDYESLTIQKAGNGFIISQNDGTEDELPTTDLIETEDELDTDKESLVTLLYMIAGWVGFVTEDGEIDPDLYIGFGDDDSYEETTGPDMESIQLQEDEISESIQESENPTEVEQEADSEAIEDDDEFLDEFDNTTPIRPDESTGDVDMEDDFEDDYDDDNDDDDSDYDDDDDGRGY